MTDLLYFILFHWYFLALKKSALRKCPYINNEFGQPIFWHVSQIWIDVLHRLSFIAPTSLIYVAWSQSGNESDLKTGPALALIGAEEHIASHHNVVSPGVLYKISLLVTWERNWGLLNRQLCRIHTGLHCRHALWENVPQWRVNYLKEFARLYRLLIGLIVLLSGE